MTNNIHGYLYNHNAPLSYAKRQSTTTSWTKTREQHYKPANFIYKCQQSKTKLRQQQNKRKSFLRLLITTVKPQHSPSTTSVCRLLIRKTTALTEHDLCSSSAHTETHRGRQSRARVCPALFDRASRTHHRTVWHAD